MCRTLSLLVVVTLLAGCGSLSSALPNRAALGSTSGMTVEQYAIGRLAAPLPSAACPKPAHSAHGAKKSAKRCSR